MAMEKFVPDVAFFPLTPWLFLEYQSTPMLCILMFDRFQLTTRNVYLPFLGGISILPSVDIPGLRLALMTLSKIENLIWWVFMFPTSCRFFFFKSILLRHNLHTTKCTTFRVYSLMSFEKYIDPWNYYHKIYNISIYLEVNHWSLLLLLSRFIFSRYAIIGFIKCIFFLSELSHCI